MATKSKTWRDFLPRPKDMPGDALAGTVNAVVSVPSGMATAAVAGVNPVYGLYATVVSPTVGGPFASSQLMQITTTGASALAAGQAVAGFPAEERGPVMFLIVGLSGLFLIAFGLLRAGRLVRYVSYPVMTAFLSGVAAVLVMDQSAQLVGYESDAGTSLGEFVDLLFNLDEVSWMAALVGVLALAIMIALGRTRLSNASSLFALVIPSILVFWWRPDGVALVKDVSEIPTGLPPFALPDITLINLEIIFAAFAVAAVIALQGAGVAQSAPNRDGSHGDVSQDMLAQGLGNAAASLFSGMPTGASVGQSALNEQVGARSRYAMVFHGLVMLLILLVAASLVSEVPMSVLAAIMIFAGFQAIKFGQMRSIWRVAGSARWAMVVTFVATTLTTIPMAVGIGVLLTMVVFIYRAGELTEVYELVDKDDGIHVQDAPQELHANGVTVLDVYGPLYFAAARTLRERLPATAKDAAVVLRIRGNSQIGATFIEEINEYARKLSAGSGRLYLCGMTPDLADRIERSGRLALGDEVVLVPGNEVLGSSLREAIDQAEQWLKGRRDDSTQEEKPE